MWGFWVWQQEMIRQQQLFLLSMNNFYFMNDNAAPLPVNQVVNNDMGNSLPSSEPATLGNERASANTPLLPRGQVPSRQFNTAVPDSIYKKRASRFQSNSNAEERKRYRRRKNNEEKKKKRMANLKKEVDESNIIKRAEAKHGCKDHMWTCRKCNYAENSEEVGRCSACSDRPERECARKTALEARTKRIQESSQVTLHDDHYCVSCSETENDDAEAYDLADELKIRREKQRSLSVLPKGKQNSKRLDTMKENIDFWNKEELLCVIPKTIHETVEWYLLFFPTKPSISSSQIRSKLRIFRPQSRRMMLTGENYAVQRNYQQLYAVRGLDRTLHGAKGAAPMQKLRTIGFTFKTFNNNRNYPFDIQHCQYPVVLNSGPGVQKIATSIQIGIRRHLVEILEKSRVDQDRKLLTLNTGLTPVQADRWWQHKEHTGVQLPGTMGSMDLLSEGLKQFIGLIGIKMLETIRKEGNVKGNFFPFCPYRKIMWHHVAEKLNLPLELYDQYRAEGTALILGNGTEIHYDGMNDDRDGYDWVVSASVILNVEGNGWSKDAIRKISAAGLQVKALPVMVICYTRKIVGKKRRS